MDAQRALLVPALGTYSRDQAAGSCSSVAAMRRALLEHADADIELKMQETPTNVQVS